MPKFYWVTAAALLAACSSALAQTVTVTVKPMTFDVESPMGEVARGSTAAGSGYYPMRDPQTKKFATTIAPETVDVIVLDNGLVEAWICPAYGGRLLRAIDKKTGVDYFWRRMRDGKWVFDNMLAWNPSGVKASFPFFEHGLSLKVPAGHRTVKHADGSVTVAMDMRFTNYIQPRDIGRYGHYGDEALTTMVTVRPGTTVVEWTQRKDNNNATPRSDRMWSDASFPVPLVKKTVTVKDKNGNETTREVGDTEAMDKLIEFLYPARWVVDHGPKNVHTSPHWTAPKNWDISHFAISTYGFAGGYYIKDDINRLRIHTTEAGKGPGAKIWTSPGVDMFEIWGGESWVFEYPGELLPAYQPSSFTHKFWIVQGIGKVSYANEHAAVSVDGTKFKLLTSRAGNVVVTDDTGKQVATGSAGPHTPLGGEFSGKTLTVSLNGQVVLTQNFPLDRPVPAKETPVDPAAKAMFDKLAAGVSTNHPTFYERQTYGRNEGQPGLVNAMETFAKITDNSNPERTASLARVAYRLGEFEHAERLAKLVGGAEGDFVLGLLALEAGKETDFGKAGWEADYLRALAAKKSGNTKTAIALAQSYIKQVPLAWYPRLAVARWSNDVDAATKLAAENPASPEAQLVLKLLNQPSELDAALANREEAKKHLAIFEAQIERGQYQPLPRYPVELLRKKGW